MEWMYFGIIAFLFILAAFDLWVGVSNDAVNFLNSAIGSKVARFRTIVTVAAVGVFCGAVMSDGMMDIARHGIMRPEQFVFGEVMLVFLAVMVTDVVLLDIFNSLGMPTSTTVSMVFELLGATFAFSMLKMAGGSALPFGAYMNTDKALQVILAIFLSVAVAFVVGSFVQYLARLLFTFNYGKRLRWKIGLFGGVAITAIIYFMLFKGLKHLSFMTAEVKGFLDEHIFIVLGTCLVVFTLLMQLLHALKVNVFRIVVLTGTFALATAFAGNDLVNFIGVPLAGLSSFRDFAASGSTDAWSFSMDSLNASAHTQPVFLFAAGLIMVFSLARSKKAHNVVKTEVGLSRSDEGDEMFGSSRVARSLVRMGANVGTFVQRITPRPVANFVERRFAPADMPLPDGAAYDLVRASVNLVVAALLIALGTSLKLPLSTTYVTFMVAMGSSLADRAWSRESAVFRVTGVLTVIGGWFITAGVAFTACFFVALAMRFGGVPAIVIIVGAGIYALIHSQRRFAKKQAEEEKEDDVLFHQMCRCRDPKAIGGMLLRHLSVSVAEKTAKYSDILTAATDGLFQERRRMLKQAERDLETEKMLLKSLRRRETIGLRRADAAEAVRLSTSFHLVHNSLRQIHYGLMRLCEPAKEHVDNNFSPIAPELAARYLSLRDRLVALLDNTALRIRQTDASLDIQDISDEAVLLKNDFAAFRHEVTLLLQTPGAHLVTLSLLLHVTQETEQIVKELRSLIKSVRRFRELV